MDYEQTAETVIAAVEDAAMLKIEHDYNRMITGENLVLYCIYKAEGKALPKDLGRLAGVSSARIAAILNRLEAEGLIRRNVDPEDNRQTVVGITSEGYARAVSHHAAAVARTIRFLSEIGEEDTRSLVRILGKIKSAAHSDRITDRAQ